MRKEKKLILSNTININYFATFLQTIDVTNSY